MALTVCEVLVTLVEPSGAPLNGATVTAKLSRQVIYQGVVVPVAVQQITNAQGQCTLELWPNALLSNPATTYSLQVQPNDGSKPMYLHDIVVSNVGVISLEELMGWTSGDITQLTQWSGDDHWSGPLCWG